MPLTGGRQTGRGTDLALMKRRRDADERRLEHFLPKWTPVRRRR
jgi:hypothetical protein